MKGLRVEFGLKDFLGAWGLAVLRFFRGLFGVLGS